MQQLVDYQAATRVMTTLVEMEAGPSMGLPVIPCPLPYPHRASRKLSSNHRILFHSQRGMGRMQQLADNRAATRLMTTLLGMKAGPSMGLPVIHRCLPGNFYMLSPYRMATRQSLMMVSLSWQTWNVKTTYGCPFVTLLLRLHLPRAECAHDRPFEKEMVRDAIRMGLELPATRSGSAHVDVEAWSRELRP